MSVAPGDDVSTSGFKGCFSVARMPNRLPGGNEPVLASEERTSQRDAFCSAVNQNEDAFALSANNYKFTIITNSTMLFIR